MVTWKPGVTPVLLVKDNQIDALAKKGELVEDRHVGERTDHQSRHLGKPSGVAP